MTTPTYEKNCLTCKNWKGDKFSMNRMVKESNHIAMDLKHGWPLEGDCDIQYQWSDIEINGDATADLIINANFGCILHEHD